MDEGTLTVYASTSYTIKTVECTKGCQIAVETAPSLNKLPDPTKTVTVSYTIRTLHSCSPTANAKKWRA
ncbi:hypothetical protein TWF173_000090 [Orbilia oligospora]|nr:hypothetical protein TWF970_000886 [Orbilia oligospora]KAF3319462.1 hypothetical protein TWF173_000090 [Orbilia oligospora]